MGTKQITLRVSEDEFALIAQYAVKAKQSINSIVRVLALEALTQVDAHHEELVARLDRLELALSENLDLTAGAVAGAVMLADKGVGSDEEAKALIRKQLKSAMGVGNSIRGMYAEGKFRKET